MSPRRGAGEGHIKRIRLKSGRQVWRAWLTVGYRANGTPIRRTAQRATRQLASEALARLRERYAPGANLDLAAEGSMRLHQLLDRWVAFRRDKARAKARSVRTYEWAADKLKAVTPHNPLIARLTPLHLQDILNQLPETLAPKSLNLCRVALKGAFAKAMDWPRCRPWRASATTRAARLTGGSPRCPPRSAPRWRPRPWPRSRRRAPPRWPPP